MPWHPFVHLFEKQCIHKQPPNYWRAQEVKNNVAKRVYYADKEALWLMLFSKSCKCKMQEPQGEDKFSKI